MWRNYLFSNNKNLFCYRRNIDSISLKRRYASSADTSIAGKQGGSIPSTKVQMKPPDDPSEANEHPNIESLLATLMARSREISTQASAEMGRGPISISDSMAPQRATEYNDSCTIHTINDSLGAADVLLSLTSNSLVLQFFQNRLRNGQSHEEISLHYAFLSVSTWICSILSSFSNTDPHAQLEINRLSKKLLELTVRSSELQLPLTLPTYRVIALRIARYYDETDDCIAPILLDLYTQAEQCGLNPDHGSLDVDIPTALWKESLSPSNFFTNPLKVLIQRRKYPDVLVILEQMVQWNVNPLVEPSLGLELLYLIEDAESSTKEGYGDPTCLRRIVALIEEPLLQKLRIQKSRLNDFIHGLGLTPLEEEEEEDGDHGGMNDDEERKDNGNDDDDFSHVASALRNSWDKEVDDLHSNQEVVDVNDLQSADIIQGNEDILEKDNEALNVLVNSMKIHGMNQDVKLHNEAVSVATSIIRNVQQLRQMQMTNTIYSHSEKLEQKNLGETNPRADILLGPISSSREKTLTDYFMDFREAILDDSIYVRDQDTWDLPDITAQIKALNKGRAVRFSRDYEDELLTEMLSDEMEKLENPFNGRQDHEGDDGDDDDFFFDHSDDDDDDDDEP
jgi:hypothetical protein